MAREVLTHDFRSQSFGVALPYGIYDLQRNAATVVVGTSHDTAEFAVDAIETWLTTYGWYHHPDMRELLVLCDSGGSNGARTHLWKYCLYQRLAQIYGLPVTVCHYPPGASKWNPIDHRAVILSTHHAHANRRLNRAAAHVGEADIVTLRTDDRGYIQPAKRFNNPDHVVVFLGASTTECSLVDENQRFPARTSFLLEEKGLKVNTLNFGRSGNNVHHSLNNLLNHVVRDRPDVAVLMHAAADIGHLSQPTGYSIAMGQIPTLSTVGMLLAQKASATFDVAGLIRHTVTVWRNRIAHGHTPSIIRKEPQPLERDTGDEFRMRLRAFVNICRSFEIIPVLMTQPVASWRNESTPGWIEPSAQVQFNQIIREVTAHERAALIDLVAFLSKMEDRAGSFAKPVFYDGIHVTDYGSSLYAEHIANRLTEILLPR